MSSKVQTRVNEAGERGLLIDNSRVSQARCLKHPLASSARYIRHKKPASEMCAPCGWKLNRRALGLALLLNLIFVQSCCFAQQIYRRRESNRQLPPPQVSPPAAQQENVVAEMQVFCQSDSIVLMVNTNTPFNGMLYARDAANAPNCLSEFHSSTNMTFRLPLKSCGTLMAEVDDGVEFSNTVIVQPHMRLMTNQGKGYHIRCKYQTRERTIANTHFNVSAAFLMQHGAQSSTAPLLATASMPMCTMKIYRIDQDNVAESVRVGDKLVMVIEIDKQDMYGMRITNCLVRDGMNKAEQQLIDDAGCPLDETIMPKFEYEHNSTRAAVAFRAHKFPHTSSIYYQCNVRLCINGGGCEQVVCPQAAGAGGGSNSLSESPSAPVPATTSASASGGGGGGGGGGTGGASPTTRATTTAGGPRRKRFIGHRQGESDQSSPVGPEVEEEASEASFGELPAPSELKLPANLSFDVYSGLYVSDLVDASDSNSGELNRDQVEPAGRGHFEGAPGNGTSPQASEACLTTAKAGLLVAAASLASVGLGLLIACQAGLLSANSSPEEHNLPQLAKGLDQRVYQQRQHHSGGYHPRDSRPPQGYDYGKVACSGRPPPAGCNISRKLSSSASSVGGKSFPPFCPLG